MEEHMMTPKILITYASRGGSTVGVAEAIAETLLNLNFDVQMLPVQQVQSVTQYDAVVAGSAIQSNQWLPEAIDFIQTFKEDLNTRPFFAFLVCMTLAMKNEKYRDGDHIKVMLNPVRALVTPVHEGYFAGVLDLNKVPTFTDRFKFRINIKSGVWEEGDHRDWEKIIAWAQTVASLLPETV